MELGNIMLSEIIQVIKDILYDLTYKWNLTKQTSEQNITRDMEMKEKLTVTRGKGGEG